MIRRLDNIFVLDTERTSYVCAVLPNGQLAHLYYGRKIKIKASEDAKLLFEKHSFAPGNATTISPEYPNLSAEDVKLEMSGYGKGDIDTPFVELTFADGSYTTDFMFDSADIKEGRDEYVNGLPGSYGDKTEVMQLTITLKERHEDVYLKLFYYVYEKDNVICKNAELVNNSDGNITLRRLMSSQIDFDFRELTESGFCFTTFGGAWASEMRKITRECNGGLMISGSNSGASSNHANPFVMLHASDATESSGEVYGSNLIYSGNHMECVCVGAYKRLRFSTGINPANFSFCIKPKESFIAPEAVLSYSRNGFGELSRINHQFIRNHIVRGEWAKKERPVLFNSWESCYFKFDEDKLIQLAKKAKDAGIELFVMDDGWFGERNDDSSSLGDWTVNRKKLPGGLSKLSNKIHDMGMLFGIWVEPEMVNVKSHLYEEHPEWALINPMREHSEGRNQRLLNLALPEVQDYIIEAMSSVFEESKCDYVKWDYNRNFSDIYSIKLSADEQMEISHRYILGLYRVMRTLTQRFPHILFEGCGAGGNRFDLGILSFFPQIWASDNTDPICRADIQNGYSYGYPPCTYSAHVGSSPNHQTLRSTDLFTRFAVAAFGQLGYEFNIADMNSESFERMKRQIAYYKSKRKLLTGGHFYRIENSNERTIWLMVSKGKRNAVLMNLRKKAIPNMSKEKVRLLGIDPDISYHVSTVQRKVDVRAFGDLVNTMAPIHIKQDSMVHDVVARLVKMETPLVSFDAYGDALMYAGVNLNSAYAGTGYGEDVRLATDYSAEMYIISAN